MQPAFKVSRLALAAALASALALAALPALGQDDDEDRAAIDYGVDYGVIDEIVVQGRLRTAAEALLDERMNNPVAMDLIDASFISRVGDSTVAGALRRVAGLTLVNDKFVYVRGLGERYSRALLNGMEVPSPDLTRNVIPLDLFPATIVQTLEVQKAYSPDMPAAFGGGSVNIRTKGIPDTFTYGLDVGMGLDSQNAGGHLSYPGGGDDRWGKDDGSRALPGAVRAALVEFNGEPGVTSMQSSLLERGEPADRARVEQMNRELALALNRSISIGEEDSEPNYDIKGYLGSNFYLGDRWEIGFLAGGSYKRSWDDTEATTREFSDPGELFQVEQESTRKTDLHHNLGLGLRFTDEHRLEALALYLRNTDDETAIRDYHNVNRGRATGRGRREYRLTFEERDMTVRQVTGEHFFGFSTRELLPDWRPIRWLEAKLPEETRFTWKHSESKSATSIPNEVTVDASTVTDPASGRVLASSVFNAPNAATFRFIGLEDELENAGWALLLPWNTLKSFVEVSFGYEWSEKTRVYEESAITLGPRDAAPSILQGDLGQVFSDANVLNPANGFTVEQRSVGNESYLAAAASRAYYGKLDWTYQDRWRIMAGLRWEDYAQVALEWDPYGAGCQLSPCDPEGIREATFDEEDLYPALALTYIGSLWAEVFQLRLGYSETVVRPDLREIVDSGYIDPVTGSRVRGKAGVRPSPIVNWDLRAEWFFAGNDSLTLSWFVKEIEAPIEFFEAAAGSESTVTREIVNAASGQVSGFELEGYMKLGFLGDWASPFFLQGNLTLQESELLAGEEADAPTSPKRALAGASDYVVNAILGYDSHNARHAATLSYNVFGERLFVAGRNGAPDAFEQPFHSLDLTYSWFPTDFITLKLRLRNALDEATVIKRAGVQTFEEKPGRTLALNFKWDY